MIISPIADPTDGSNLIAAIGQDMGVGATGPQKRDAPASASLTWLPLRPVYAEGGLIVVGWNP